MADWKQVQARIRKAKTSSEPVAQLSQLFERTRDGMVAYEIAQIEEAGGRKDEAIRWFTSAAERFRRSEWKKKALARLERLGAPAPDLSVPTVVPLAENSNSVDSRMGGDSSDPPVSRTGASADTQAADSGTATPAELHRRRRRGRRGGRGRRRKTQSPQQTASSAPIIPTKRDVAAPVLPTPTSVEEREPRGVGSAWATQAAVRAGEPALASRMAKLENLLRRLIGSPLHRLDEADQAPAGPGVLLLSEADLSTTYYVEACQTLRIALAQLTKSSRGSRAGRAPVNVRALLAEHLGISDSQATKYLKDHCAVRWIQLDDQAFHLASFAIAVLQPALNQV